MPGNVLTTASQIQCQHGGRAILVTANTRALPSGSPALLESDVHIVVGCTFDNSPCVHIEWSAGASKIAVDGTSVLDVSSIGKCLGAGGGTQGIAIVVTTQARVLTG